jgi:hypothetical protein
MECGSKHFSSKKELENYIRGIIKTIGLCESVKAHNIEYYNFFIDLFRRHPNYPEKIYGIIDIIITENKVNSTYLELNMLKEHNIVEDISWRKCISGAERDNFKSALRIAIQDQIDCFRNNNSKKCELCNIEEDIEYHVDHINHFEEIVYEFLQNTKFSKPTIFRSIYDNRKAFMEIDKEYENMWKIFHKSKAQLRILCRSCNLKRPKWKCL